MLLSTGAIVPELRVGREWELEGKLVNMWCIVMCMSCYIMLCHVVHVLHVQVIMCCVWPQLELPDRGWGYHLVHGYIFLYHPHHRPASCGGTV